MSHPRGDDGLAEGAAAPWGIPGTAARLRPLRKRIDRADAPPPPEQGALDAQQLVLDSEWRVLAGQASWFDVAAAGAYDVVLREGQDFRRYCEWCALWGIGEAAIVLEAMDAIDRGESDYRRTYKVHDRRRKLRITSFQVQGARHVVLSRLDLSELFRLRSERLALQTKLSGTEATLARIREDERERVARELHDGAAQCLVGIRLGLAQMRRLSDDAGVAAIASDLSDLVQQFQTDLRFLTYTLYPPLLQQMGLHLALGSLCAALAQRSGIDIRLSATRVGGRRDPAIDAVAYRLVQEALGNVHKHASALRARVRLFDRAGALIVVVTDDGTGLVRSGSAEGPAAIGSGLGIPGMIARVHELGGRVTIHSRAAGRGTIMAAILPHRRW